MNRPSNVVDFRHGSRRLRSVAPMSGAEIVSLNGDTAAAYSRADLQARGDFVWNELQKLPRQPADLGDWLNRGRRTGFNPRVPWGEWVVVMLVFGAICFALAVTL